MSNFPGKILIVDDGAGHRLFTCRALKLVSNAALIEAESLQAAQNVISTHSDIVLILCDLSLGRSSGVDLVRAVKSASPTSQIPILILSTSALNEDVWGAYRCGANSFLTKESDLALMKQTLLGALKFFCRESTLECVTK